MIRVTRLSGEVLYLNILQIESMESIPETKINRPLCLASIARSTSSSTSFGLANFFPLVNTIRCFGISFSIRNG